MIVIDASALLEVLLETPAADGVRDWIGIPGETVHAPHLIDLEIAQVVRRLTALHLVEVERGRAALLDLARFRLRRYAHFQLLPDIWQFRNNLTAYDAVYVALARVLDAPLLTRDSRLLSAARRYATVQLV